MEGLGLHPRAGPGGQYPQHDIPLRRPHKRQIALIQPEREQRLAVPFAQSDVVIGPAGRGLNMAVHDRPHANGRAYWTRKRV